MRKVPAVFLDRDGVINPLIYHRDPSIIDSPFTIDQFQVYPAVPKAIRLLNDKGFAVVIVSNQPGVAKGHFHPALLHQLEVKLCDALVTAGAHLDGIYYCLHHPEAVVHQLRKRCACRKPGTAMLKQAARDLNLSLKDSYMVGDGLTDIEAGYRAGCKTVFIGRWKSEHSRFIHPSTLEPTFVARDLLQAARVIQRDRSAKGRSEKDRDQASRPANKPASKVRAARVGRDTTTLRAIS